MYAKRKTRCSTAGGKRFIQDEFKVKLLGSYVSLFLLPKRSFKDVYKLLWPDEVSYPPMENFQKGSKEYRRRDHPTKKNGYEPPENTNTRLRIMGAGFTPKGIAPCIGIGLRRRLAKEFVVVDTPEHYTSKTCSGCHCECGPFVAK